MINSEKDDQKKSQENSCCSGDSTMKNGGKHAQNPKINRENCCSPDGNCCDTPAGCSPDCCNDEKSCEPGCCSVKKQSEEDFKKEMEEMIKEEYSSEADSAANTKIDNKVIEDLTSENLLLKAEIQNLMRRYSNNAIDVRDATIKNLVSKIAPILDVIDLAIKGIQNENDKKGVQFLKQNFMDILKEIGIDFIIPQQDDIFDSGFHEAISIIEHDKDNTIESILSMGMKFKNKLILPAKVVVRKKNIS